MRIRTYNTHMYVRMHRHTVERQPSAARLSLSVSRKRSCSRKLWLADPVLQRLCCTSHVHAFLRPACHGGGPHACRGGKKGTPAGTLFRGLMDDVLVRLDPAPQPCSRVWSREGGQSALAFEARCWRHVRELPQRGGGFQRLIACWDLRQEEWVAQFVNNPSLDVWLRCGEAAAVLARVMSLP